MELKIILLMLTIQPFAAVSYVLHYCATVLPPGPHFPEITVVGVFDDTLVETYNSNIKELLTKIEWDNKSEAEDYCKNETKYWKYKEHKWKDNLKNNGGIYTFQLQWCCQQNDRVDNHVITGCKTRHAHNGEEIKTEMFARTVADVPLPEKCSATLSKYIAHGRTTLDRKVAPSVSVVQKNSSSPVVCHATGFFPKKVTMFWQKNGEDLHEDVELRKTLPNHDGTFQKRSILNVSIDELNENNYACVVKHSSLENEIIRPVPKRKAGGPSYYVPVVAVLLLLLIVCAGYFIWRKFRSLGLCSRESGVSMEDRECKRELTHTSTFHNVSYCSTECTVHAT